MSHAPCLCQSHSLSHRKLNGKPLKTCRSKPTKQNTHSICYREVNVLLRRTKRVYSHERCNHIGCCALRQAVYAVPSTISPSIILCTYLLVCIRKINRTVYAGQCPSSQCYDSVYTERTNITSPTDNTVCQHKHHELWSPQRQPYTSPRMNSEVFRDKYNSSKP